MTQPTSRYLLLDGAKIDDLPKQIYSLEDSPSIEWLYHMTAYQALFDVGPALVLLRANGAVEQAFTELWQSDAGLMIESSAPFQTLVEHLRSLVHIRAAGDVSLFFRYYDPRVMRHWLPALDPAEKDRMMGPVHRIRLPPNELSGEQWITRDTDPRSAERYAQRPWLYLDEQQLQQLNRGKHDLFDRQLLEHVRNYFPEGLPQHLIAEQLEWAALCREGAARHGYSTSYEVSRWAAFVAEHGTEFPNAPEHLSYRQILEQRTLDAAQRLAALQIELHRHFLLGSKEPLQ